MLVIQYCFKLALLIMFYIATFCLLSLKKNTGHTVKRSKKDNVHKQEKERHKKVEINKLNNNNKKLKKRKNQSCALHDESITFLQGNISQYTRKL